MKYFLDTEFIESFHNPLFGKRRHFIDLISIGIVAEDGRKYEAISNEYNYKDASQWVKDNVILPLYKLQYPAIKTFWDVDTFHKRVGKSNAQIAQEIISFVNPVNSFNGVLENKEIVESQLAKSEKIRNEFYKHKVSLIDGRYYVQPEFWGYYCDYDWVLFCSLFGTMGELPKGFPKFCYDVQQLIKQHSISDEWVKGNCPEPEIAHTAIGDALWIKLIHDKIKKYAHNNL